MAFGHAVQRRGFESPDDRIKGQKGDVAETLDGMDGDDVIIAFDGDDTVVGGDGEDDLSGGGGNDLLVGAIWTDADEDLVTEGVQGNGIVEGDEITQDAFSDDFNAEADFASNGSDTIWYYDDTSEDETDPHDVVDLSDAIEFVDQDADLDVDTDDMLIQLNATFDYDATTGALGTVDGTWFTIYEDAGTDAADMVYVEVDGTHFVSDGGDFALV